MFRPYVVAASITGLVGGLLFGVAAPTHADISEPPTAAPGLVTRYHFDAYDGDFFADDSGNHHDGEISGMNLVPGRWGNAIRPASSSAHVKYYHPMTGRGAVTVLAWVHKNEDSPGAYQYVVSQGAFGCTAASWAIYTGAQKGLQFYVYDGNRAYLTPNVGPGVWDNTWHAVAGVFDGHDVALYVDGRLVGSPQPADALMQVPDDSSVLVGNYGNTCQVGGGVDATMDEVTVYDTALTAQEIIAMQLGAEPQPSTTASFVAGGVTSSLRTTLDGRASKGAVKYRWDLNNDGINDVECGKDSPVLQVRMISPGSRTVSLTTTAADGQTSVSSHAIAMTGPTLSAKAVATSPQVAVCGATPEAIIGGKAGTCADRLTFGVVEVDGCLSRITDDSALSAEERALEQKALAEYQADAGKREYIFEYCTSLDPRDCWQNPPVKIAPSEFVRALRASDFYYSTGTVHVNGVDFTPTSTSRHIIVAPQIGRIISGGATLKFGPVPLSTGPVNLDVLGDGPVYSSLFGHSASTDLGRSLSLGSLPLHDVTERIAGLLPIGSASLALKRNGVAHFTDAAFTLQLPPQWTLPGGIRASGNTVIRSDNDHGVQLESIFLRVQNVNLGPVQMKDLTFEYERSGNRALNCNANYWKTTGTVLFGGAEVDMTPPPQEDGIAFCGTSFLSGGAHYTFPSSSRPVLYPGVLLKEVGLDFGLRPPTFNGDLTISIVDVFDIHGGSLVTFGTRDEPYRFTKGEVVGADALAGHEFTTFAMVSGGAISLPTGDDKFLDFGDAYFAYVYPNYVAFGGKVEPYKLPGIEFSGSLTGELAVGKPLVFSVHGQVKAAIERIGSVGADVWVTSKGVVACASVGGLNPGVGYHWGGKLDVWLLDGCKPSGYWVKVTPSTASLSSLDGGGFSFRYTGGSVGYRLVGSGSAPRVRLIGPDGTSIDTSKGRLVAAHGVGVLPYPKSKTTYIGLRNAKHGLYRVQLLSGSSRILARYTSGSTSQAKITARVSGSGTSRTLTYSMKRIPGRTVTFYNVGPDTRTKIGLGLPGTHKLTFAVGNGSDGARHIVAEATVNGAPTKPQHCAPSKSPSRNSSQRRST